MELFAAFWICARTFKMDDTISSGLTIQVDGMSISWLIAYGIHRYKPLEEAYAPAAPVKWILPAECIDTKP
mgnify:CR=1